MIFGIDLGTTNSLIGVGDQLLTDLVSSNVDVEKGEQVARDVMNENIVASYKTNMSMSDIGQLSIQCSSIILKKLAELGSKRYGEKVEDVVISVPAYFTDSQRKAVYKAAEIAGLNLLCVMNEPTAAALYMCHNISDLIVVYDLGGGTFDITIIDSRTGINSVIATNGTVLGGDDLDQALANKAIKACKIPLRYRTKLGVKKIKFKMRLAKEEIQRTHSNVVVDLSEIGYDCSYTLTVDEYKETVNEVFGKTIEITEYLISENIPYTESPKIAFVGGSSACPYLKEMVKDALGLEEIKCDMNPDLIVAKGIAMYAQLLYEGKADLIVEDVTKRLCIEDMRGQSITIIESNSIVPCRSIITVSNNTKCDKLRLKLYQGDSLVAAKNDYIGTLVYHYGREVEAEEGVVEVEVSVMRDGIIKLSACEVLFSETAQAIELTAR